MESVFELKMYERIQMEKMRENNGKPIKMEEDVLNLENRKLVHKLNKHTVHAQEVCQQFVWSADAIALFKRVGVYEEYFHAKCCRSVHKKGLQIGTLKGLLLYKDKYTPDGTDKPPTPKSKQKGLLSNIYAL